MKKRIKKFFKDHEDQLVFFIGTVASATGVGVILGRKIADDNKIVRIDAVRNKETNELDGYIGTMKNGHLQGFFRKPPE